jgi:hypothetical protein
MRPTASAIAVIFLISTAVVTGANAQQHGPSGGGAHGGGGGGGGGGFSMPHGGGGGGGGGFSMPHGGGGGGFSMPHGGGGGGGGFSMPHGGGGGGGSFTAAPRVSAPQVSAPHFSAPSARFNAPHITTAPRSTASHVTSRNFTASHTTASKSRPSVAARNVAPRGPTGKLTAKSNANGLAGRNATPRLSHNVPAASTKASTNRSTKLPTTTATGATAGAATKNTATKNAGQLTLNTPQTKHLQMHYTGGSPILRNTTLANRSSHDPTTQSLTQSTFRGSFAQSNWGKDWGWRHHHNHFVFGFVLGFVGPVFWPYAYDDCIDYLFWPYAYDTFWPYAFDDVYQGIYGAYAPQYYAPEDVYAYAGAPASSTVYSSATGVSRPSAALPGGSQICSGQEQGLTDFPIERIAAQVNPDRHQRALLDDLKAATAKAVGILKATCPNELPSTPTGRLEAMRSRVEAMLRAVQEVRPALDAFYNSLSDEQKERFNALDEDINTADRATDVSGLCDRSTRGTGLPVARIERSLQLNLRQDTALKDLNDASAQAADILKGTCRQGQSLTPTGRLAAMTDRLNSMLQALGTVQPALVKFYESLSDEQKARFDRLNVRPA